MSDDSDRIDELYREHRDEPPAELDAAILAAARDNAARPWYRDLRYLTTVATAASFVLAAMVVYYAPQEGGVTTAVPVTSDRERREDADRTADQAPRPAAPAATPVPTKAAGTVGTSLEEAVSAPRSAPHEPAETEESPQPAEAPTDAGRSLMVQDAAKRMERSLPSLGVEATRSGATAAGAADMLATLADRCGPPPGTDDTRTLDTDALGWYLRVVTADAVTYYRCENGAWREVEDPVTPAAVSEQEPDSEDDQ